MLLICGARGTLQVGYDRAAASTAEGMERLRSLVRGQRPD